MEVTFRDYAKSSSVKVAQWLIDKGYIPADTSGVAHQDLVVSSALGLLLPGIEQPKFWLFDLIPSQPRGVFLGTLWFENELREADEQNWIFEIYGRQYVEQMRQLAEEMTQMFQVNVHLDLVLEEPRVEAPSGPAAAYD